MNDHRNLRGAVNTEEGWAFFFFFLVLFSSSRYVTDTSLQA